MRTYKVREAIMAMDLGIDGRYVVVTLGAGTIVRTIEDGESPPISGLVHIQCDGQRRAVFRRDLEERGDRISETSADSLE